MVNYIMWSFIAGLAVGALLTVPDLKKAIEKAFDDGYKEGKRYGYEEEVLNKLHQQYKD